MRKTTLLFFAFQEIYRAGDLEVTIDYKVTSDCKPDEDCEYTAFAAKMTAQQGNRTETRELTGGCGV